MDAEQRACRDPPPHHGTALARAASTAASNLSYDVMSVPELPVDHQRRRAGNTQRSALCRLGQHRLPVAGVVEAGFEGGHVQADGRGDALQPAAREPALVLAVLVGEQVVVVLPVAALASAARAAIAACTDSSPMKAKSR